ncbi:MAG: hypothetical protein KDK70_15495 [Myxococcales bacterium]|nr:hypothetical protein [Myxococcales bacterium]
MSELPKRLLQSVCWSCSKERHADRAAFGEALRQYQLDIRGSADHWDPDARILELPRVRISFECWEGESQLEPQLTLEAEDGAGFGALELMYGICDGIAAHLQEHGRELYDHHFFEGISAGETEGVPLYFVRFGS